MFGPTGPKHLEEKNEGGRDASRHGPLIYRHKLGPKHIKFMDNMILLVFIFICLHRTSDRVC